MIDFEKRNDVLLTKIVSSFFMKVSNRIEWDKKHTHILSHYIYSQKILIIVFVSLPILD